MRHAIHLETRGRLALLLIIPVLVSALMWLLAREASRQIDSVQHTLFVELSVERMIAAVDEAESSQRGYLLTGEPQFLRPYYAAAGEARGQLSKLDVLTKDNPLQQTMVSHIRPMVEQRLGQIEENIRLYRTGAFQVSGKASIERGSRFMDSIRALATEVYEEEERLLRTRERALSQATTRFWWSLAFEFGVILLAGASLYRNMKRYGQQAAAAEDQLSRLNAKLDQKVQERTASLEAREELLNMFVKYVPAAVAMLDPEMNYLQVSDRWCTDYSLDRSQMLGRSHYEIFPDLPERWKATNLRCLAGETFRKEEDHWDKSDGTKIWVRWETRPWGNKNGRAEGILIFAEDITQRKRTDELLRESEATTRALLDTAAQAILAVNSSGEIVLANRMAGEMFGYSSNDLIGRRQDILLPERLRERHKAHRAEFAAHPKTRPMGIGLELLGVRKDGSEFPIEVSLSSFPTTRGPLAVSFVSDITLRKQAETALRESEQQLRALAGSLLDAQENERRRVARELHDDVTQRLAFLSIELGKLAGELPDSLEEVRARIRALQNQSLHTSTEVRRLSHGLHPSVILDFGLGVALEEFCQEFGEAQGICVEFEGLVDDSRLDGAAATCLYRVAQESLRNAVIHGRATKIQVSLNLVDKLMRLRVIDNGRGFPARGLPVRPGLGIVSMRERIRLVSGTLLVFSEPEKGTEISASVPLAGDRHESISYTAR